MTPAGYRYGFYKVYWNNEAGYAYVAADYVDVTFDVPINGRINGRGYIQSRMSTSRKYRLGTYNADDRMKLLGRYKAWWIVEWNGKKAYIKN